MQPPNPQTPDAGLETATQSRILAFQQVSGDILRQGLDTPQTLTLILEALRQLVDADSVALARRDGSGSLVYAATVGEAGRHPVGSRWPEQEPIAAEAIATQRPIFDPIKPPAAEPATGSPNPSGNAFYAPLLGDDGRVLGIVWAARSPGDRFFMADFKLFSLAGEFMAQTLLWQEAADDATGALARYRHLFEDSFDPVLITYEDGIILEANEPAAMFFGRTIEELEGSPVSSLHAEGAALVEAVEIPGKASIVFESVIQFRDPGAADRALVRPVEVRVRRLETMPLGTCQWIYHDLSFQTELKQIRQDLVTMVVHDLRSPLGNVISSLELIKMVLAKGRYDPELLSLLDVAARSSGQLLRLIESLLDISRFEAGYPLENVGSVHVKKLAEELYEIVQPELESHGVTLTIKIDDNLPLVAVNEGMISRVLLNLVDNALKYSRDGQIIDIAAEVSEADQIEVSVTDAGPGVPEAFQTQIFEKYERAQQDQSSSGLGLGLAFSRMAVEAHGGRIWVEDAPDGGARFIFLLPIAEIA